MPKRPPEPPVTPAVVSAFLEEYSWLARSRKPRERLAYRIIERLADDLALRRVAEAGREEPKGWRERVSG